MMRSTKDDLTREGYGVVAGALPPDQLAVLRQAFAAVAEAERAPISARGIEKLGGLLNKGRPFEQLAEHPVACALAEHLLGPGFLLSLVWGRSVSAALQAGRLHAEQYQVPPPWPGPAVMTALWMLDDFTPDNGATRVVPRSHLAGCNPVSDEADPAAVAVTGVAGSLLVCDGRLWHHSGRSVTGGQRRAIGVNYCAHWVRPQDSFLVTAAPAVVQRATPRLRQLLGLDVVELNYYRPIARSVDAR